MVLNIRGPHRLLPTPVWCLLRGDGHGMLLWRRFPQNPPQTCCSMTVGCSSRTSRGSLLVVILLLPSDRDGFGCSEQFSPSFHHDVTPSVAAIACLSHSLCGSSSSLSRRVTGKGCCGRCARWCYVSCLMLMIHHERLQVEASAPVPCPVRFSSEAPIRDG